MESKEKFIERYNDVKESIVKAMDDALLRAVENEVIDFNKLVGNYLDVYPLMAAVLQKEIYYLLEGSSYESIIRTQKQKAKEYMRDFRIWHDYAGDYRGKDGIIG